MLNKKRNCKKFQRFLKSILINFSPRVFAYLVIIDLVSTRPPSKWEGYPAGCSLHGGPGECCVAQNARMFTDIWSRQLSVWIRCCTDGCLDTRTVQG